MPKYKHDYLHPNRDIVIKDKDGNTHSLFAGQCGYGITRHRNGSASAWFECDGRDYWLTLPKGGWFTSEEGGIPNGY